MRRSARQQIEASSQPDPAPQGELRGYEAVVAICGGIAAYKVAMLVSRLVQRGAGVTVAMTESAQRFITPLTFESLTGRRVFRSLWDVEGYYDPQHLRLTEGADLFVVAPATANIIGKVAGGLADDLVSTMIMSTACPVLLVPAMNTRMWENPIVQRNLTSLIQAGYRVLSPGAGWLACRTVGVGRMAEPEAILEHAVAILKERPPKALRTNGDGA